MAISSEPWRTVYPVVREGTPVQVKTEESVETLNRTHRNRTAGVGGYNGGQIQHRSMRIS